ncbi:hypothetical protein ACOMHN_017376 [Nucella lapillus]
MDLNNFHITDPGTGASSDGMGLQTGDHPWVDPPAQSLLPYQRDALKRPQPEVGDQCQDFSQLYYNLVRSVIRWALRMFVFYLGGLTLCALAEAMMDPESFFEYIAVELKVLVMTVLFFLWLSGFLVCMG